MANMLLVDDNKELLETLSTLLKMKGYNVQAASSDEKAKNALSAFVPDVILLDVKINGSDGRELCKEIKENHSRKIPIILLSAFPDLLKNYDECNADAVIEKPFDLKTIMNKIVEVLNKYQTA